MTDPTPSVTPMPVPPAATVTNLEAPFPPADPPLPVFVPPSVTDPVSNLDFLPVDDAFALEMRSETIEQLVGGDALRRGESERIEAGRSQTNADLVAGRDRVRVHATLHEHIGHALAEVVAHLHTTVDGTLDVHAGNEDTVLLAGHMRDRWDGGAAIVAAMTRHTPSPWRSLPRSPNRPIGSSVGQVSARPRRSHTNADLVAGRDRVRVHATLHEHTGHGRAEEVAHLHTTVDGTLDVHTGSEDTVLLAGHMRDLWDGGTAIVAAMTDDTVAGGGIRVAGGGIRVTTPLDLWVHGLTGAGVDAKGLLGPRRLRPPREARERKPLPGHSARPPPHPAPCRRMLRLLDAPVHSA